MFDLNKCHNFSLSQISQLKINQNIAKKEKERNEALLKVKLKRVGGEWTQSNEPSVNTSPAPSVHTPICEPPPSKSRRIANVPKGVTTQHRPLTPSSKSPSVERSPYNGIGLHLNSPGFSLDGLLTPTSISPNEEMEIDPKDQIVSTIVNWDAEKIIDPRYKKVPYHTNLVAVPMTSFDTFDYYQKCVLYFFSLVANRMIAFHYKCSSNSFGAMRF